MDRATLTNLGYKLQSKTLNSESPEYWIHERWGVLYSLSVANEEEFSKLDVESFLYKAMEQLLTNNLEKLDEATNYLGKINDTLTALKSHAKDRLLKESDESDQNT